MQITKLFIKNTVRVITGDDTIDAVTDYRLLLNSGAGAFNLSLPPGIDNLTFVIGAASTSLGTFTLVPNGTDTVDATVSGSIGGAALPVTFFGGVWYNV